MPDDYSADRFTTGTVAVGDTATGNIGSNGDGDWFAVELVRGSAWGDGTLSDPYLRGVYDADGNLIPRTTNDDGGQGYNSRLTFTWATRGQAPTQPAVHFYAGPVHFYAAVDRSGHSVEIVAIWLAVYLSLSLATSAFMNWYNSRIALVDR